MCRWVIYSPTDRVSKLHERQRTLEKHFVVILFEKLSSDQHHYNTIYFKEKPILLITMDIGVIVKRCHCRIMVFWNLCRLKPSLSVWINHHSGDWRQCAVWLRKPFQSQIDGKFFRELQCHCCFILNALNTHTHKTKFEQFKFEMNPLYY